MKGLLDSGASVSCIGQDAEAIAKQLGLKIKKKSLSVKTADGASQPIIGYIDAPTTFKNQTRTIRYYLIPSLQQTLYLGCDFWYAFGLMPILIEPLVDSVSIVDSNMHDLAERERKELNEVISSFPSSDVEGLGRTNILQHNIDTENASPIKQRYYAVSPAVQKLMDIELDRMLTLGVIEPSQSPWSSPMVLIRKDNGKNRLCLDSRALNKVTRKDAYPLPIINGLLSRLGDTHYISSIDLKDAFWQIELDEESRMTTAFTVPGRPLLQFQRMPFGLCNAAQTMCRLMDLVMGSDLRDSVFVYIDDLLIVSPDFASHIVKLKIVSEKLRAANLTINVNKSKFCMREIKYLGYLVGNGQLKTDPDKVSAIENFPIPKTVRQVRRFIGMTGWYQRFIRNYSAIAAPMTDLVGKKGNFTWPDAANDAFNKLKTCLSTAPVLNQPDFTKHFYIQCDASLVGVGSVLFQISDDGEEHPIAFHSKKLNSAQRKYSVTELECYAAVLCVKHFRAYVELMPFTIITDHASLKWLMNQKDLSGRLGRWSLKLQSFNFDIQHRKGTANVVDEITAMADDISLYVEMGSPHFNSNSYVERGALIRAQPDRFPDLRLIDNHIYHKQLPRTNAPLSDESCWKLWLPDELTAVAVERAHDASMSAHRGVEKTVELLRRYFFWPGASSSVICPRMPNV